MKARQCSGSTFREQSNAASRFVVPSGLLPSLKTYIWCFGSNIDSPSPQFPKLLGEQ